MLIFDGAVRRGVERGGVMAGSRFFGIRRPGSKKEPDYVRTTPFDGGKYIDLEKFLEDEDIQKQFEWFEQADRDPRSGQSSD